MYLSLYISNAYLSLYKQWVIVIVYAKCICSSISNLCSLLQEWWQCKSFLKTNDLFRLINRFDVRKVEPEVANRVRQVLGGNKLKAKLIVNQSKAAAAFYAWVL